MEAHVQHSLSSLSGRWLAFSKTRRGVAVNLLAGLFALILAAALATDRSGQLTAGDAFIGIVFGTVLGWGVSWCGVALAARVWEERTQPIAPPFARRAPSGGAGAMLRVDRNAQFWQDRGGFLWAARVWFTATGCPPVQIAPEDYADLAEFHLRREVPVPIAANGDRQWWWWDGTFYWESGAYSAADVKALIFQRERRKRRELEHAHTMMAVDEGLAVAPRRREPIPEDVKRYVFRRDDGRCQVCGSTELLQFDHIIPFTMGGSNEPENLQLLCATCNRAKGGQL